MSRGAIVVLGASSPVARALAVAWAARGHSLVLGGRDREEIERIASDIAVRFGVGVEQFPFDVRRAADAGVLFSALAQRGVVVAGVVVAIGYAGDEQRARRDAEYAQQITRINFTGLAPFLEAAAEAVAAQANGFLVCIGSVAGDRPRRRNYTYGAAKAELARFLEELRTRTGAYILTVKPGYIDTAMIWNRQLRLAAPPERVAGDILRALAERKTVVYTPWFWRWIMLAVRSLPAPLFRRLQDR